MQVNGLIQVITGVFYVPDLKNNLLSIGQLQEKGINILIQHGKCKLYHPERGLIMETAIFKNRMFVLSAQTQIVEQTCFNSFIDDPSRLWHCRYGHLSFNGLKLLQQKNMVSGLPHLKAPAKVCEHCLIGKHQRDQFPQRSTWRATQILQLVHTDIYGPITPTSNSKKRYLINFIDDFSRKTWVYFLVEKSEAFVTFKNYKSRVEKKQVHI